MFRNSRGNTWQFTADLYIPELFNDKDYLKMKTFLILYIHSVNVLTANNYQRLHRVYSFLWIFTALNYKLELTAPAAKVQVHDQHRLYKRMGINELLILCRWQSQKDTLSNKWRFPRKTRTPSRSSKSKLSWWRTAALPKDGYGM